MRRRLMFADNNLIIGQFATGSTASDWLIHVGQTSHDPVNGSTLSIADKVDPTTLRFAITPAPVDGSLAYTFYNTPLAQLIRYAFPPEVINAQGFLSYCSKLTAIDLSPLAGSNVTNARGFIRNCTSLAAVDLSPLAKSSVTVPRDFMIRCEKVSAVDTTPLRDRPFTDVGCFFKGCISLTSLDLSFLATLDQCTIVDQLAAECTALRTVDFGTLSYDQAAKWTNYDSMFNSSSNISKIRCTETMRNWLRQRSNTKLPSVFYSSTSSTYWDIIT